jgi:hypothetical protein
MSNTFNGGFITVTKTGATVTTAATTARITMPDDSHGRSGQPAPLCAHRCDG